MQKAANWSGPPWPRSCWKTTAGASARRNRPEGHRRLLAGALGRDMPASVSLEAPNASSRSTSTAANGRTPRHDVLTPREREVLRLVARRYTTREIAEELVLSVRTVERHVENIYAKPGVSSRRLATAYARQHVVTTD